MNLTFQTLLSRWLEIVQLYNGVKGRSQIYSKRKGQELKERLLQETLFDRLDRRLFWNC